MERGIRFNCEVCGTPFFVHENTIFTTTEEGGGILPYCTGCRPPEDYKELENVQTWDFECTEDEWKEIVKRQREMYKCQE